MIKLMRIPTTRKNYLGIVETLLEHFNILQIRKVVEFCMQQVRLKLLKSYCSNET